MTIAEREDIIVFSLSPLKFRTAGFPQYGFKRDVDADLRRNDPTYTATQSVRSIPVAPRGMCGGSDFPDVLVQRPLARQPVMLSGGVSAYYGLIRATRHRRPAYLLRPVDIYGREWVPNLSCVSFRTCHPQYPGGSVGCT